MTFKNSLHPTAKLLFIISYLLFIISSEPAAAQKQKRAVSPKAPTISNIEQARQALDVYDFELAESSLEKEIAALKRKKKSTAVADSLLARAHQGMMKLHATERIVVIDSIVCSKAAVLKAIHISHESGRLDTYASTYHTGRQAPYSALLEPTLYENEFGNKRYLSLPASHQLAVSDKIGDRWSEPTPLTGLIDDNEHEDSDTATAQNFPFLLSDGITLYYAATGPESLGGLDIFVTRSDGEDGSFLKPENVGFPYNSPANDYLLAIDEFKQLGYFVSDRHQPADSACIYVFIPNETRQLYGDDISERELRDRARLTAIRDTWDFAATEEGTPQQIVKAARQRLTDLRNGTAAGTTSTADFVFPIDDTRTYTRLADFRSPVAREKMKQWVHLNKDITTDATMLERLRDNYATAKPVERKQLSTTILQLEATYYPQLEQLSQLAKEIRNEEIGTR